MEGEDDTGLPATETLPAPFSYQPQPEGETPEGQDQLQPETEGEPTGEEPEGGEGDESGEQPAQERQRQSGTDRNKRTIERLRRENAELRARVSPVGDVKAEVDRIMGPPPKEADFPNDYTEYSTELTAYKAARKLVTQQVQERAARDKSTQADRMGELVEAHLDRVEEFRESAPDFDDVMKKAGDMKVSPHVEDLILESDQSAGVQYFLAKNPRHLDRLNAMTERQAAREIGRIEAHLSQPSQRTQHPRAPRPIVPLRGGSTPPSQEAQLNSWIRRKYGDR